MKNHRMNKKHRTGARALFFGIIFTISAFFIISFVCAIIISRTENPSAHLALAAVSAFFSTAAVSAFATAKYKGEGGMYPAMLSALACVLISLIIGVIVTNGKLPLINVVNLLCYLGISFIFALLAKKRTQRYRHKR